MGATVGGDAGEQRRFREAWRKGATQTGPTFCSLRTTSSYLMLLGRYAMERPAMPAARRCPRQQLREWGQARRRGASRAARAGTPHAPKNMTMPDTRKAPLAIMLMLIS